MPTTLEQRILTLERQVAQLQQEHGKTTDSTGREWLNDLYGAFAADPVFDQAMKLGRAYRKSTRPATRKTKARR